MSTEGEIQAEMRRLLLGKSEASTLLEAFQAFVEHFMTLKADNAEERKQRDLQFKVAMKELRDKMETIKSGTDGTTPRPGIDYPSREQFAAIMEAMRPKTPVEGEDYTVPKAEDIARLVAEKYLAVDDVFRIIYSVPDNIIQAINQAKNLQINADKVDGLEKLIKDIYKKQFPPIYTGAGAANTTVAVAAAWSTPTETPDGIITLFTVGSSAPTDVVADGIVMYSGQGYTYAAGQITFTNPPTQYVRYR